MKQPLLALILLAAFLIVSCDDELRTRPLQIRILQNGMPVESQARIRGVIDIEVLSASPGSTKAIRVMMKDSIYFEVFNLDTLRATFDTRTLKAEGYLTIQAVSIDDDDKKASSDFTIEMDNVLLRYFTSRKQLFDRIILSDEDGNIFENRWLLLQLEPADRKDEHIFFYPPNFKGSKFDVTFTWAWPGSRYSLDYYYITTIKDVTPGTYDAPLGVPRAGFKGSHEINLINAPPHSNLSFETKYVYEKWNPPTSTNKLLQLSKIESDLFLSLKISGSEDLLYKYHPVIRVDNSTVVNDDYISTMQTMSKTSIQTESLTSASTVVYGKYADNERLRLYYSSDAPPLTPHYPLALVPTHFESFLTEMSITTNIHGWPATYSSTQESTTTLPSQFPVLAAELVSAAKITSPALDITMSGQADYVKYSMYTVFSFGGDTNWFVYAPFKSDFKLTLPKITKADVGSMGTFGVFDRYENIEIELIDSDFITSYQQVIDYCMGEAPPIGSIPKDFINNVRSKKYKLK